MQSRYIVDIRKARDSRGKAIFSNEELRRAELTIRLSEDSDYQELCEQLRTLDSEENEIVVEHNRLVEQKSLLMLELGPASRHGEDIPHNEG